MQARVQRQGADRRLAAHAVAPVHRGPQAMVHDAPSSLTHHAPNAALLIDFDNVTMGIQKDLHSELRNLLSSDIIRGKVAVQRAYADWRRYPGYIVPLTEASIDLIWAPAYGSAKKNATDIRLAVDAIELVFTRSEIGTFILLSGDSDFSSLVIKLKEYGKYVIGVGIRESSSDLLVQNCDEYYSYNALAGLVKTGEEEVVKWDPWELVTEAITRMTKNGDVMRSDRLKQVMQEIDPAFEEKNAGFSKFSRFVQEAVGKGLLKVTKLDNGQLEVSGVKEAFPLPADVNGRDRRGRRGRGGDAERAGERPSGEQPAIPEGSRGVPLGQIGRSGDRLTKDEAFDLVRRALAATGNGHASVSSRDLRRKAFELLGRDSESLSERFFARILKDAQDAEILDLKRRGRDYQVEARSAAPGSVSERLNVAAAAHASSPQATAPAVAALPAAAPTPAAPASPRGVGGFGRRDARTGRPALPPANLLSIGVVEALPGAAPAAPASTAADAAVEEAPTAAGRSRRGTRGGRGRSKAKATARAVAEAPNEGAEAVAAPRAKRPRRPRAKKTAKAAVEGATDA
ncbi:MAG: NYN domain-containing protein [Gemmatimonadaceae bacterium]